MSDDRKQPGLVVRLPVEIESPEPIPEADLACFRAELRKRCTALAEAGNATVPRLHAVLDEVLAEFGLTISSKFGPPYVIDESDDPDG